MSLITCLDTTSVLLLSKYSEIHHVLQLRIYESTNMRMIEEKGVSGRQCIIIVNSLRTQLEISFAFWAQMVQYDYKLWHYYLFVKL